MSMLKEKQQARSDEILPRAEPLPVLIVHLNRRKADTQAIEQVQKKPRFETLQLRERREADPEEVLPCLCVDGAEYRGLPAILQYLKTF